MPPVTYIALGLYSWGKGTSQKEARKLQLKNGPSDKLMVIKRLPEGAIDAYVDEMGTIKWTWAVGADRSARCEVVYDANA